MRRCARVVGFCLAVAMLGILTTGCAVQSYPRFEDSNQVFLEETIAGLDLVRAVKHVIPERSRICLASMETSTTRDFPVIAMIEDGMITTLRESGYVLLERDDDMLRRLAAEGGDPGYRFLYLPSDESTVSARAGVTGVAHGLGVSYGGYGVREVERVSGGNREEALVFDTSLATAEYVISYRVLECGIIYRPGSGTTLKEREGLTRLHIRVTDVDTGEVLFAGNVDNTQEDEIKSRDVDELSDFHYSFYSPALPVVKGTSSEKREMEKREGGPQASPAMTVLMALAATVFGIWAIGTAASGGE